MKIALSGVGVNNKGAELMFYAVLQELERRFPQAIAYVPEPQMSLKPFSYIKTSIKLKFVPNFFWFRVFRKLRLRSVAKRIYYLPVKNADYLIDVSGFQFSDQFNLKDEDIKDWELFLSGYKKQGSKVCFLSQAFGPFKQLGSQKAMKVIDTYSDLIVAREQVSLNYLKDINIAGKKVKCYSDFTSLVDGIVPEHYSHLRDAVCIIPNTQMTRKLLSLGDYLEIVKHIADTCMEAGYRVYLLNHESGDDERLAYKCQTYIGKEIEIVTGLNALEVKGMISTSYLCISSRFHGVASSLNTCVPCLSTSWSHKYHELYKDYNIDDMVLNLEDKKLMATEILKYLDKDVNLSIRKKLEQIKPVVQQQARDMWEAVWNCKSNLNI